MNHRIFERTLRSWAFLGACLFEYHGILNSSAFSYEKGLAMLDVEVVQAPPPFVGSAPLKCISVNLTDRHQRDNCLRCGCEVFIAFMLTVVSYETALRLLISNQVGLPAELKHINKRRKRN